MTLAGAGLADDQGIGAFADGREERRGAELAGTHRQRMSAPMGTLLSSRF